MKGFGPGLVTVLIGMSHLLNAAHATIVGFGVQAEGNASKVSWLFVMLMGMSHLI
jgi:NADH:ubiquinone oxidoreductase subunit K